MTSVNTTSITPQAPLPPYIYGRECGPNEKVWSEDGVRRAQAAAVAFAHGFRGGLSFAQTVDAVVFGLFDDKLVAAMIPVPHPEVEGASPVLMLPGGLVNLDNDADDRASMVRVFDQLLGTQPAYFEQAFTVSGTRRGVNGWVASVIHLAFMDAATLQTMADSGLIELVDVEDLPDNIGFDHKDLVMRAVGVLRERARFTTIVGHLLGEVFSFSDLHRAYEVVRQGVVNPANFRRKIMVRNLLVEAEMLHGIGRPSQGYKLAKPLDTLDIQIV